MRPIISLLVVAAACDPAAMEATEATPATPGGKADSFGPSERLDDPNKALPALLDASQLAVAAELPYPPGNVTAAADGRLFFTFHPEGNKGEVKLAEWIPELGSSRAFPDQEFQDRLHTPLSLRIDQQNRLWLLDYGDLGLHKAKVFAIDVATGDVVFEYTFPRSAAGIGSMLNDFRISGDGKTLYIADQSLLRQEQAIVVVDLDREFPIARRRLVDHASVDNGRYAVYVDDKLVKVGPVKPRYGVDAIALDPEEEYLYYASLNRAELYRVPTDALRYEVSGLPDAELANYVEKVADITLTDGVAIDSEGNLYLSDMEHSAIVRVDSSGAMAVLFRDPRLRWPDGFGWSADGSLYVTASALHLILPDLFDSEEEIAAHAPYQILRFVPQAACEPDQACAGLPGE